MRKHLKGFILLIFILIVIAGGLSCLNTFITPTANIYTDDEGVTCSVTSFDNNHPLEEDICDYVLNELNDYDSDIDSVKEGIEEIGKSYGIDNLNVNFDSPLGVDKLCTVYNVKGTSMVPTLQDGQTILVEKTKDISVNDVVVANSPEYGVIVKRVSDINGDKVHLISDNKNVEHKIVNGRIYELKGITTWLDISNIYGVVKL